MIRFACPSCKTVLQAEDGQAGTVVACPTCKTPLRTPPPAARPPAPAPVGPLAPRASGDSRSESPTIAAPNSWYYARNGQRFGPFSEVRLREMAAAGEIRPTDQVSSTEAPQWTSAASLFGAARSTCGLREPAAPNRAGGVKAFGAWLVREAGETARATWGQTRRLMVYGGGLLRGSGLRRAAATAARGLGERMSQSGGGDPALRARIGSLEESIRQAEAAKKSARPLRAECETLLRQLAAPALSQTAPLPGLETEHGKAREAHAALEGHAETMKAAKAALPPHDGAGWRRVLVGGGVLLVGAGMLLGAAWMLHPGAPPGGRGPGDPAPATGSADLTDPPPGSVMVVEKPLWSVKGGPFWGSVTHLAFLSDGRTLFARGGNGESKFFTLDKGTESPAKGFMIRSQEAGLTNLAFGWEDQSLFARYLADDRFAAMQDGIRSVARQSFGPLEGAHKFLSPDGKILATAIEPPQLRLWDAETGKPKTLDLQAEDAESDGSYHATSIAFSPDGKKLAVWGKSGLKIWDAATGKMLAHLNREVPTAGLAAPIVFSPDGALLAANRPLDHTPPTIWDCAAWQPRCTLKLEGSGKFHVRTFSADHKVVVTTDGSTRYRVTTWDAATGDQLHRTDEADAQTVFFSPDGVSIVAGGGESFLKTEPQHEVLFWNAVSGRLTRRVTDEMITTFALAPNGKLLATGNMKAEVKLWDLTRSKAKPVESGSSGSGAQDDSIKLTALQLYLDYKRNPVIADQKYARKWLAVTGEVVKRDDSPPGFAGMILIGLRGSPEEGDMVSCYFDRQGVAMLKRLDDSDYPPIVGECLGAREVEEPTSGKKTTVLLTRCSIPGK